MTSCDPMVHGCLVYACSIGIDVNIQYATNIKVYFLSSETQNYTGLDHDSRRNILLNFNLNDMDKDRYRPLSNDRDGFRSFSKMDTRKTR